MSEPLRELAPDIMPMLEARRLRVASEMISQTAFGNAVVLLVGEDVEILLTRDRSLLGIEVRALGAQTWWGLKILMGFVTGDPRWEGSEELRRGDDVRLLDERWDTIVRAVSDEQEQEKLAEFAEMRTARIVEAMRKLSGR